jgi:hypothetical protein
VKFRQAARETEGFLIGHFCEMWGWRKMEKFGWKNRERNEKV